MSRESRRPSRPGPTPVGLAGVPPALLLVVALLALLLLQYRDVFHLPFLFDDYAILKKVHERSLIDLWMPRELLYGWYRPWSRETHFWVLERIFGPRPAAFHAVNLGLWLACMMTFYALARRLAGSRAATIATCGLAVFGGWSGTLLWASGAQESWMVLFSLIALSAFLVRRTGWATASLALALLSKETACVVPGISLVACLLERDNAWVAVRRLAPLAAVVGVWAFVHPTLHLHVSGTSATAGGPATNALRTVLSFANLQRVPKPEHGWLDSLGAAFPVLTVLSVVLVWIARADAASASGTRAVSTARTPATTPATTRESPWPDGRVAVFGLGWCALASIPPMFSGGSWAAYYGVLAACGAWLAAAVLLARRPLVSAALILVVAMLQASEARTPAWEWGAPSFQRRAALLTTGLERSLRIEHPSLPPHTRIYLELVPQGLGAGEKWFEPVVQAWYTDTTITVERLSSYRLRTPGVAGGKDLFLAYVPPTSWVEVRSGPEDVTEAIRRNPHWPEDHKLLALAMGRAGDWRGAALELEKLTRAFPEDPQYLTNLAYCLRRGGDAPAAARWQRRADSLLAVTGGTGAR